MSVDTLGPTAMSASEANGTTYDGATKLLTSRSQITPGKHSIYFSVLDYGDPNVDSAVLLDNLRFLYAPQGTCSFTGTSDEVPPGLVVCGPVASPLPPCGGLIPPPRPLVVCGPQATILPSCKGLALGLGPKPFLGNAAWDPIEVKCDDDAGFCDVDIDAELDPKNNPAITKFGGEEGIRPSGSAKNALKLANLGLAEASYDNFDALRALGDIASRLEAAGGDGAWYASFLGGVNTELADEFGIDNDMVSLGQQALDGVTKSSLADFAATISRSLGGLKSDALLSLNPDPAGDVAEDLTKDSAKLIQQMQAEQARMQQTWTTLAGLAPKLPPEFIQQLDAVNGQVGALTGSIAPVLTQLKGEIKPAAPKWTADAQALMQQMNGMMAEVSDLVTKMNQLQGEVIGRIGTAPPPGPADAMAAMADLQKQANEYNQLVGVLVTNQTAMHGMMSGLIGPATKLSPALPGGFASQVARMYTDLQASVRLDGVLQEMAPLAFPNSGTPNQVNSLSPNNTGSGPQLQKIQATLEQFGQFQGMLNSIQTKLSQTAKNTVIQSLVPRLAAAKPKGAKAKKAPVQLGSTEAVLAPGQKGKLKLKLTKRAKSVLKQARRQRVKRLVVKLHVRVADGSDKTVEKTFKVKVGNGKPAPGAG